MVCKVSKVRILSSKFPTVLQAGLVWNGDGLVKKPDSARHESEVWALLCVQTSLTLVLVGLHEVWPGSAFVCL